MEIKYWAGTDVGRKRADNEDNFLIDKRLKLFVVADGMGGHASGEIASAVAVHGIREIIARERDILDTYDDDDPKSHVEVCTLLEYAVHHTCESIFLKARAEPEKRGMGTTLVVLLVIGARGFIAYVGDSRIYLLRGGIVYQLTEDHSLKNELIRMGKITADEFESSPYANLKNAMTRAVGVYESVEVDTLDFDIIPGDSFLLCSDGLYEYLSEDDIANVIGLPQIREVPGMLIDTANSRGGKDNITAVVVQVASDDATDDDRAAELNFTLDTLKNVPLFRELTYQQLVRVMNLSEQNAVEPGQQLFCEGDTGQELLVVLRGRVELTRGGVPIAELSAGAHLGEMSLVDAAERSATATALDAGKILAITRDDFFDVLRREPALAVKLLWSFVRVLAQRLRNTTDDLATARSSAESQVDDLTDLAEDAARSSPELPILELDELGETAVYDPPEDSASTRQTAEFPEIEARPRFADDDGPLGSAFERRQTIEIPRVAPSRPEPRVTLISTTTSDIAPPSGSGAVSGSVPPVSSRPIATGTGVREGSKQARPAAGRPSEVPRASSQPIGVPPPVPPTRSDPIATGAPGQVPRAPSDPIATTAIPPPVSPSRSDPIATTAVPPPVPTTRSSPIATGAPRQVPRAPSDPIATGAPRQVPRAPSDPIATGRPGGAPPPVPRASSTPINTGHTVVPPSAKPRAVTQPTPSNTGHTVVPPSASPRPVTQPTPSNTGHTVVPPSAKPRPVTQPTPGSTGGAAVPPAAKPRGVTQPTPKNTGHTVVPPPATPNNTGDTVVPPSANPRPREPAAKAPAAKPPAVKAPAAKAQAAKSPAKAQAAKNPAKSPAKSPAAKASAKPPAASPSTPSVVTPRPPSGPAMAARRSATDVTQIGQPPLPSTPEPAPAKPPVARSIDVTHVGTPPPPDPAKNAEPETDAPQTPMRKKKTLPQVPRPPANPSAAPQKPAPKLGPQPTKVGLPPRAVPSPPSTPEPDDAGEPDEPS